MMDTYYLNVLDTTTPYQIVEAIGETVNPVPVAAPTSPYLHFAWPSAVRVGGTTFLYMGGHRTKWDQVVLYTKTTGVFSRHGAVLTATVDEGGIGPNHLLYVPGESEPFHLYYSHLLSKKVSLATSADGISFTRRGVILDATALAMAFVSTALIEDGTYHLLLHGTDANGDGRSYLSSAATPAGPFSAPELIADITPFVTTLAANAQEDFGTVPSGVTVPLGVPLTTSAGDMPFVAVARAQVGTRVYFDDPFLVNIAATLASNFTKRIDLSEVQKQPDGSWRGVATGFNSLSGIAAEYTGAAAAPALDGPWTLTPDGVPFSPHFYGGRKSTENPSRLQVVD